MHNYKTKDIGEWWDEYECKNCGKRVVLNAEDGMSIEQLNEADTSDCNICEETGHA